MKVLVCSPNSAMSGRSEKDEFNFFSKANIQKIEKDFEVIWNDSDHCLTKEELIEKIPDADAVITSWCCTKLDADVVNAAKKLKIVVHLGGTVKAYVGEEVFDRGIKVISANDTYFSESVAEGALAYALAGLRHIDTHILNMHNYREDGWRKDVSEIRGLLNRTVGIVSFGSVARYFVKLLQPFHCKIKVYSRSISDEVLKEYNMERASLEEIFSTCDVISVHTAYNEHTKHFINRELMGMIKEGALFMNTARGGVVDEAALTDELKKKRFAAVLDVFEQEPLPESSELYSLDNVIIFPHKAGPTQDMYQYLTSCLVDEMRDYLFDGKQPISEIPKKRALEMSFA